MDRYPYRRHGSALVPTRFRRRVTRRTSRKRRRALAGGQIELTSRRAYRAYTSPSSNPLCPHGVAAGNSQVDANNPESNLAAGERSIYLPSATFPSSDGWPLTTTRRCCRYWRWSGDTESGGGDSERERERGGCTVVGSLDRRLASGPRFNEADEPRRRELRHSRVDSKVGFKPLLTDAYQPAAGRLRELDHSTEAPYPRSSAPLVRVTRRISRETSIPRRVQVSGGFSPPPTAERGTRPFVRGGMNCFLLFFSAPRSKGVLGEVS